MIGALLFGLVAGLIGRALVPNDVFAGTHGPRSWAISVGLGLIGAMVGYVLFTVLLGIGDTDVFDWGGVISAVIGVVIVLLVVGAILRHEGGGTTPRAA